MTRKPSHTLKNYLLALAAVVALICAFAALPAFADPAPEEQPAPVEVVDAPAEPAAAPAPEEQPAEPEPAPAPEQQAEQGEQPAADPAEQGEPEPAPEPAEQEVSDEQAEPESEPEAEPEAAAEAEESQTEDEEEPQALTSAADTEWSIRWKTDDDAKKIDWLETTKEDSSQPIAITAVVTWSPKKLADGETLEPGDVQIRLPYQIFTDREGKPMIVGGTSNNARVGVARTTGESGVYYTVEEALANPASDSRGFNWIAERDASETFTDIVLFNTKKMTNENGVFTCEVIYYYYPSQVIDMKKYELPAKLTVAGQEPAASGADTLSVTLDTSVTAQDSPVKGPMTVYVYRDGSDSGRSEPKQYLEWLDAWGEKPADADNYVFVPWYVYQRVDMTSQPFTVSFVDDPSESGGRVFAYSNISQSSYSSLSTSDSSAESNFTRLDSDGDTSVPCTYTVEPSRPGYPQTWSTWGNMVYSSSSSLKPTGRYLRAAIIVGYPKSEMPADGSSKSVNNKVTMTITPLDGADEVIEKSRTISTTLYDQNFSRVPNPSLSLYKYAISDGESGSTMRSKSDLEAYQLLNDIDTTVNYYTYMSGQGFKLTHDGSDAHEAENYNVNPYTFSVYDDLLYIQVGSTYHRLEPGDYEFERIYLNSAGIYKWDFEAETSSTVSRVAANDPYVVSYKIGEGAWTEADTKLTVTGSQSGITLPDGVTGIKISHEGKEYSYYGYLYYTVTIHPTAHVKKILQDALSAGEEYAYFGNATSERITDHKGVEYFYRYYSWGDTPSAIRDEVSRHDVELGKPEDLQWIHDYAHLRSSLKDAKRPVFSQKTASSSSNTNAQASRLSYSLQLATPLIVPSTDMDVALQLQELYNAELDNTVFYDLLPEGVLVDASTISASYRIYNSATGISAWGWSYTADFEYEIIDNYKGTNRQLVKITVKQLEENEERQRRVFDDGRIAVGSGIYVGFYADYPWSNALLYGTKPHNVAVATVEGPKLGAGNDTDTVASKLAAANLNEKEIAALVNVDGKGGPSSDASSDYYYLDAVTTIDFAYAEMAGLNKGIKASVKPSYTSGSSEVLEGTYTYELRYTPEDGTAATGLVFYDVLENAYGENAHWKANEDGGSFTGVSVGQALKSGVDAKVYFSTEELDPKTDTLDAAPAKWKAMEEGSDGSFTLPSGTDPTSVKSLAFDYRKATDGSDYVLGAGGTQAMEPATLTALIYMKAPDRQSAIEKQLLPLEGRIPEQYPVFAYNNGVIEMKIAGDETHEFGGAIFRDTNTTTLRLCDPFIQIEKLVNGVDEYEMASRDEKVEFTIKTHLPVQANNDAGQINYNVVSFIDSLPRGFNIDRSTLEFKLMVLDEEGNEQSDETISFGFTPDAEHDYKNAEGTEYCSVEVETGDEQYGGYLDISFPAEVARRYESRMFTITFTAYINERANIEGHRTEEGVLKAVNTASGSISGNSKWNGSDEATIIIPDRQLPAVEKQVKVNDGEYGDSQELPGTNDVITYKVTSKIPVDGTNWQLTDDLVEELELTNPEAASITVHGGFKYLTYAEEQAFLESIKDEDISYQDLKRMLKQLYKDIDVSRSFTPAEWNALNSLYSSWVKTDAETGEVTNAFDASFTETGFAVRMGNSTRDAYYGIYGRYLWALFNGTFETQVNEETGEETLVFTVPKGTINSYYDEETGKWVYDNYYPNVDGSLGDLEIDVEFTAKLREGANLSKYIQDDGKVVIPNVAVSDVLTVTGATSTSNSATLVTELPINKLVNGMNRVILSEGQDTVDYSISVEVPANSKKLVVSDKLDKALSLKGGTASVQVLDGAGEDLEFEAITTSDGLLTVTVEEAALAARAGTAVTVNFPAKVDLSANPSEYEDRAVPNTASFSIDDGPEISSNTVNVVLPPTEPWIKKTVEGAEALELKSADETFTYEIAALVTLDATELKIADILDASLAFAGDASAAYVLDESGARVAGVNVRIEGQEIAFTVPEEVCLAHRGEVLTACFEAKAAKEAVRGEAIPNVATCSVNGGEAVESNEATVTVPADPEPQPKPQPKPTPKPTPKPPVPKTGDEAPVGLIAVAAIAGVAAVAAAITARRKK